MIFLIYFAVGIGIYWLSMLLSFYADSFFYPHIMCVEMAPHDSMFQELYQALVCGYKISNHSLKEQIRSLGLLHLFVVSGTHLHFISLFTESLLKNKKLSLIVLGFYSLSCGLKAPVIRAFTSQTIKHFNLKYKLGYKHYHCLLVSYLLLFPLYTVHNSFTSLTLSTLASLIVEACSKSISSSFFKHLAIFCLISILFLPLQTLHPITLFFTYWMTPIICYIFIPLCFLSFFNPTLTLLTDRLWNFSFIGLNNLSSYIPNYPNIKLTVELSVFISFILISYFFILRTQK